jgi:hypothetical protein
MCMSVCVCVFIRQKKNYRRLYFFLHYFFIIMSLITSGVLFTAEATTLHRPVDNKAELLRLYSIKLNQPCT